MKEMEVQVQFTLPENLEITEIEMIDEVYTITAHRVASVGGFYKTARFLPFVANGCFLIERESAKKQISPLFYLLPVPGKLFVSSCRSNIYGRRTTVYYVDVPAFLRNIQVALANQQYGLAQNLLDFAIPLSASFIRSATLESSLGLHPGYTRPSNEDCVLSVQGLLAANKQPFGLFLVCDGMGGHKGGLEAASLSIFIILKVFLKSIKNMQEGDENFGEWLVAGIQEANQVLYGRNLSGDHEDSAVSGPVCTSQIKRMGTTVTAAFVVGSRGYIANVGDSRAYLYRPTSGLQKVTKDHSVVAQLVEDGVLPPDAVYTHPQRNQIYRNLGSQPRVDVDLFALALQPQDTLLLCSDGLWEKVRDQTIERLCAESRRNLERLSAFLVMAALETGGEDNISCIVLSPPRDLTLINTVPLTTDDPIQSRVYLVPPST